MTQDELWSVEEAQLTSGIAELERGIDLDKLDHKRKQSNMGAMLRHLKNELAEHNKKKPLKLKEVKS